MTYRIKVTKVEPNPDYAGQVKAYESRARYEPPVFGGGNSGYPTPEREVGALEALITPGEWEIVKRALVQYWATTEAQP